MLRPSLWGHSRSLQPDAASSSDLQSTSTSLVHLNCFTRLGSFSDLPSLQAWMSLDGMCCYGIEPRAGPLPSAGDALRWKRKQTCPVMLLLVYRTIFFPELRLGVPLPRNKVAQRSKSLSERHALTPNSVGKGSPKIIILNILCRCRSIRPGLFTVFMKPGNSLSGNHKLILFTCLPGPRGALFFSCRNLFVGQMDPWEYLKFLSFLIHESVSRTLIVRGYRETELRWNIQLSFCKQRNRGPQSILKWVYSS